MSIIIYKIFSTNGPKVYVGSTKKLYLCLRKADHRSKYRLNKGNCASYELFNEYGLDNCIFEEIERVDLSVRFDRERYWVEELKAINYNRPYSTDEEKKKQQHDNHQRRKIENPDKYKEQYTISNLKQKDKLSKVIVCDCGVSHTLIHKNRHLKSKFHIDFVNKNLNQ